MSRGDVRVGIDGRALTGRYTGDRTYWLNLLRTYLEEAQQEPQDAPHYVVYSRLPIPAGILPDSPHLTLRTLPSSNDRLWTLLTFPRALKQDQIALAHTQYTTPLHAPCPVITTVHDISFRLYPEWFPRKHRLLLNLSVPGAMRRAQVVITDSQSSLRDMRRIYGLAEQKIVAIPLAAGPEYTPIREETRQRAVKERYGLSGPYVLSVGVLQPRKNLPLLLEGFARARRQAHLPHTLALTGKRGWGDEGLVRQAARLQITDAVRFTDYVPDDDLPALYSAAEVFAYPSLYEGFGLPPLEAMACGTPTLVSDAPAMPEVTAGGAWSLSSLDAVPWGDALARLLTEEALRVEWSERGRRRADAFTWQQTAAATRALYAQYCGAVSR